MTRASDLSAREQEAIRRAYAVAWQAGEDFRRIASAIPVVDANTPTEQAAVALAKLKGIKRRFCEALDSVDANRCPKEFHDAFDDLSRRAHSFAADAKTTWDFDDAKQIGESVKRLTRLAQAAGVADPAGKPE